MCFSFHEKSTISGEWLTNDVRVFYKFCFLILWELQQLQTSGDLLALLEFSQCVSVNFTNIISEISVPEIQGPKIYLRQLTLLVNMKKDHLTPPNLVITKVIHSWLSSNNFHT